MKKRNWILALLLIFLIPSYQCELLEDAGLSDDEIARGLKEALRVGTENAVFETNQTDGYFNNLIHPLIKIPFPEDAQFVEVAVSAIPLVGQSLVDDLILKVNRAAEGAADRAKPIFWTAIEDMTILDAASILYGNDDAATEYLRSKTYQALVTEFKPDIQNSLDQVGANNAWDAVINQYNQLPVIQPVTTDLPTYTTEKALDGLFVVVEDEEKKIRENPSARINELLQSVFGQLDE